MIDARMFDELAPPRVNEMRPNKKIQLGMDKGKQKINLNVTAHPTQAFKKPREHNEHPRLQRERLPSRGFRWPIL